MKRASVALALTLVVTSPLLSTGCSWITVQKPPPLPVEPAPPVACTASNGPPVFDTVLAVLSGLGGVAVIVAAASTSDLQQKGAVTAEIAGGAAAVAVGGLFAVSAASGYSSTAQCRDLQQSQAACLTGVETACRSLRLEPAPPSPVVPTPVLGD